MLMKPVSIGKNPSPQPSGISDEALTFEKVWLMFQKTDKKFQETDKQFKETDKKFQETDKKFQETDKKFQETDKKLNNLEYLFTSQWGKLVESLVEGDLLTLLKQRGVDVTDTIKRRSGCRDGINYEFDIIAINGNEIVIVEVKTTLRPGDIRDFLKKLKMAKTWMPEYSNKKILGAVAFLAEDAGTSVLAERKGLFMIRATGDSASIIYRNDFVPKCW